jgi:hypothetical protein
MTALRLAVCLGVLAGAARMAAQNPPDPPPYPQALPTAALTASGLPDRRIATIMHNACDREKEFLQFRAEMLAGNFDHQGEDLLSIVSSKMELGMGLRNADGTAGPNSCTARLSHADLAPFSLAVRSQIYPWDCEDPARASATELVMNLTSACLLRQVNESVLAMRKVGDMGTTGLVCLGSLNFGSQGEYDVTLRELVRLLYLAKTHGRGRPLAQATLDHMYKNLLAARGRASDDTYPMLTNCSQPAGDELGTPEDAADRHEWYNEMAGDLGNIFDWLVSMFTRSSFWYFVGRPAIAVAPFLIVAGIDPTDLIVPPPFAEPRISETENHRLMIESSRFLTNADMIQRLKSEGYDHVDEMTADQNTVREWLLKKLQDIVKNDFREFNARPYTRYSLGAILNLADFATAAGDPQVATAAQIVLDLSEAKFAAFSNRGRRVVPYRRRSEYDGYNSDADEISNLYHTVMGADDEVSRSFLLTNQTQLLPDQRPPWVAYQSMADVSTSTYSLPAPVMSTAVDRRQLTQMVRHTGVEMVFQSPAFTVTAGGIPTEPTATLFGKADDNDFGVAMPTTIMATIAGTNMKDLFRFESVGTGKQRRGNLCVAQGFACGIAPIMSDAFPADCGDSEPTASGRLQFVSSQKCASHAAERPAFFLAARVDNCTGSFCEARHQWGVMDIVEAPEDPAGTAYETFKTQRRGELSAIRPDAQGRAAYTSAAGQHLDFALGDAMSSVTAVGGVAVPAWSTTGDVLQSDGRGNATIKGSGGTIVIDFTDWKNPQRRVLP